MGASPTGAGEPCNIATLMEAAAARLPDKDAVVTARTRGGRTTYSALTFGELAEATNAAAAALTRAGIQRGTRTVLLVKPSPELFALTFALFKLGAIPALVDPGIGVKNMVRCLQSVEPEGFVAIPKGHVLRLLFRSSFRSVKHLVTVGGPKLWGGHSLAKLQTDSRGEPVPTADTSPDDTAAILFTSGSTGTPKGAVYRHETFVSQVRMLQREFGFTEEELDLATFPLFALFDAALGVTCVLPDMDPTKPGQVRPEAITQPIRDLGITSMFGSPALLERVAGGGRGETVPTIQRVISAGAPVQRRVLESFHELLPHDAAAIFTPYGATESLPVAKVSSRELLSEEIQSRSLDGWGVCIGRPVEEMTVRVIRLTDEPIPEWSEDLVLAPGEVGEIAVKGPVVTHEYWRRPEANELAKIREDDHVWHRMGDLGCTDAEGRLWFAGRKAHRVETAGGTLFSVRVETIFNQVEGVRRTALVGVGERPEQVPVLFVERLGAGAKRRPWQQVEAELRALASEHDSTRGIEHVLDHPAFPVDIRHNAKIFREKLVPMAEKALGTA